VSHVLRLPSSVFRVVAPSLVSGGAEARSCMWDNLERGRLMEVWELNGEVIRIAAEHGLKAPVNAALVDEVRTAEREGRGSPRLGAAEPTGRVRALVSAASVRKLRAAVSSWGRPGFDGGSKRSVACRGFFGDRVKTAGKTQKPTTMLSSLSRPKHP